MQQENSVVASGPERDVGSLRVENERTQISLLLIKVQDRLSGAIVDPATPKRPWASVLLSYCNTTEASGKQAVYVVEHVTGPTELPVRVDGDRAFFEFRQCVSHATENGQFRSLSNKPTLLGVATYRTWEKTGNRSSGALRYLQFSGIHG